ncbi:MAG: hypothetical protein JSS44_01090 [Proteobacteria bacterium]|nr:hypothetical protein [Pseudomonadota bacterium]
MNRLKLLSAAALSALLLSACNMDKNQAAKDPVTAAKDLSVALHDNDIGRFSHIMVPPDDYAKLEARFKDKQSKEPAPTADASKQFADQLAKFTEKGAEDKLFAEIQPKLAQMGPQIPMGVAMMSGMLGQGIEQNPKYSPAEKEQAKAVLTAVTKWATTAPLADEAKAKQAIGIVVATVRDLNLTTLDAANKMSFAEVMGKAGTGFGGLKKALAVYGFDIDQSLSSVKVDKKSEDGDNAVVTISYTILGAPVTADVKMVRRDGRWYSADLVKSVEDSLSGKADDAAPAAAPEAPVAPDAAAAPDASGAGDANGQAPAVGSLPEDQSPASDAGGNN